jgi:chromosome segregation ATPase
MVGTDAIWTGETDGTVRIRRLPAGTEVACIERKQRTFCNALLHINGAVWAALSDGFIRVYDASNNQLLHEVIQHDGAALCLHLGDGKVYSGGADWKIYEWNPSTYDYVRLFYGHANSVRSIGYLSRAVSSSAYLFSGADDGTVRVWDPTMPPHAAKESACLHCFKGHTKAVLVVVCVESTRQLWSGSEDHAVRVWDLSSFQIVGVLDKHRAPVTSITSVGDRVWSGGKDGRLFMWDPVTLAPIQQLGNDDAPQHSLTRPGKYIRAVHRVATTTTCKVWCCGSDGTVECYQADGTPSDEDIDAANVAVRKLEQEAYDLHAILNSRDDEVATLKHDALLRHEQSQVPELEEQVEALRADCDAWTRKHDVLAVRARMADDLVVGSRQQLDDATRSAVLTRKHGAQSQAAHEQTIADLTADGSALRDERDTLQTEAATQRDTAAAEISDLRGELNSTQQERDEAREQLATVTSAAEANGDDATASIATLVEERDVAEQARSDTAALHETATADLQRSQKQVESLEAELAAAQATVDEKSAESEQLQGSLATATHDREVALAQVQTITEATNSDGDTAATQVATIVAERDTALQQVTEAHAAHEAAQKQATSDIDGLIAERAALEEDLAKERAASSTAGDTIADLRAQLDVVNAEQSDDAQRATVERDEARGALAEAERQLQREAVHNDGDAAVASTDLVVARGELQQLRDENARLTQRLDEVPNDQPAAVDAAQTEALRSELDDAYTREDAHVRHVEALVAENDALRARVDELDTVVAAAPDTHDDDASDSRVAELEKKASANTQEIKRLQAEAADARKMSTAANTDAKKFQDQCKKETATSERLRHEAKQSKDRLREQEAKASKATTVTDRKLAAATARIQALQQQRREEASEDASADVNELQQRCSDLQDEVDYWTQRSATAEADAQTGETTDSTANTTEAEAAGNDDAPVATNERNVSTSGTGDAEPQPIAADDDEAPRETAGDSPVTAAERSDAVAASSTAEAKPRALDSGDAAVADTEELRAELAAVNEEKTAMAATSRDQLAKIASLEADAERLRTTENAPCVESPDGDRTATLQAEVRHHADVADTLHTIVAERDAHIVHLNRELKRSEATLCTAVSRQSKSMSRAASRERSSTRPRGMSSAHDAADAQRDDDLAGAEKDRVARLLEEQLATATQRLNNVEAEVARLSVVEGRSEDMSRQIMDLQTAAVDDAADSQAMKQAHADAVAHLQETSAVHAARGVSLDEQVEQLTSEITRLEEIVADHAEVKRALAVATEELQAVSSAAAASAAAVAQLTDERDALAVRVSNIGALAQAEFERDVQRHKQVARDKDTMVQEQQLHIVALNEQHAIDTATVFKLRQTASSRQSDDADAAAKLEAKVASVQAALEASEQNERRLVALTNEFKSRIAAQDRAVAGSDTQVGLRMYIEQLSTLIDAKNEHVSELQVLLTQRMETIQRYLSDQRVRPEKPSQGVSEPPRTTDATTLLHENHVLRTHLAALRRAAISTADAPIDADSTVKDKLSDRLRQKNDAAREMARQLDEVLHENDVLQSSNTALRLQLIASEAPEDEAAATATRRVVQLEATLAALTEAMDAAPSNDADGGSEPAVVGGAPLRQRIAELDVLCANREATASSLMSDVCRLTAELDRRNGEVLDHQRRSAESDSSLAEVQGRLTAVESALDAAQREIAASDAELAELRAAVAASSAARQRLELWAASNDIPTDDPENILAEAKALHDALQAVRDAAAAAEEANAANNGDVTTARSEAAAANDALHALEDEFDNFKADTVLAAAQQALLKEQVAELEPQLSAAVEEKNKLTASVASLREKADALQSEATDATTRADRSDEEAQSLAAEKAVFAERCEEQLVDLQSLRGDVAAADTDAAAARQAAAASGETATELGTTLDDVTQRLQDEKTETRRLTGELAAARDTTTAVEAVMLRNTEQHAAETAALQQRVDTVREEEADLQVQLRDADTKTASASEDAAAGAANVSSLQRRLALSEELAVRLRSQVAALNEAADVRQSARADVATDDRVLALKRRCVALCRGSTSDHGVDAALLSLEDVAALVLGFEETLSHVRSTLTKHAAALRGRSALSASTSAHSGTVEYYTAELDGAVAETLKTSAARADTDERQRAVVAGLKRRVASLAEGNKDIAEELQQRSAALAAVSSDGGMASFHEEHREELVDAVWDARSFLVSAQHAVSTHAACVRGLKASAPDVYKAMVPDLNVVIKALEGGMDRTRFVINDCMTSAEQEELFQRPGSH